MRGHLQCRDTLAGNEGCPLKTGTTVFFKTAFFFIRGQSLTKSVTFLFLRFFLVIYNRYFRAI